MNYKDIIPFMGEGDYEVDVTLARVPANLENLKADFNGLNLNPIYQRGNVWTETQQIAYIEFLLRGGKSARVIYFNSPIFGRSKAEDSDLPDEVECVDGLQRITAIIKFVNNEIKAFDTYFKDFENFPKNSLTVRFNINNMQYRKDVLQWYIDYNSGGTVHSKEEIERVKQMLLECS